MEVIITTHHLTPHIQALHESNPGIKIHVAREDAGWTNCDRIIRNWWMRHFSKVASSHVCVIEYDVLVTKQLPEPTDKIHVGRIREVDQKWMWWADGDLIAPLTPYGITPFGIFMCPREALNKLCDIKWDDLYSKSIISELRTPSIWHAEGFEFYQDPAFALCSWRPLTVKPDKSGIFHPVK